MAMKPVDRNIKVVFGPAIDDTDFKSREEAITFDAPGMEIDVIVGIANKFCQFVGNAMGCRSLWITWTNSRQIEPILRRTAAALKRSFVNYWY